MSLLKQLLTTSPPTSAGILFDAYRKSHEIEGSAGAGIDYQVKIVAHYKTGYSAKITEGWTHAGCRPEAIKFGDKSYFTYLRESDRKVIIRSYNHATDVWGSPVEVATTAAPFDAHDCPALGRLPDGKLIIFYGCHNDPIEYKISTNADDESAWGAEQTYPNSAVATYPQVITFSDKIVLFYRHRRVVGAYRTRRDTFNGVAWSGATNISEETAGGDVYYWWFTKIGDNIYLSGYYHDDPASWQDVYFAYSTDEGVTWKEADGTGLAVPMGANALILASATRTIVFGFCLDENNKPVIPVMHRPAADTLCKLAVYSAALGSSGSWSLENVIDEGDNQVYAGYYADFTSIFPSLRAGEGGRPTFWARIVVGANYYMRRYSRQAGETAKFDMTHEDDYASIAGATAYAYPTEVWNSPSAEFEVLSSEKTDTYKDARVRGIGVPEPGEDIYLNEKCRTDFGDIRFTESDGLTELDYWMQEKVDGDYAVFWVEVSEDLGSDRTIYVYYGKADVTITTSDGDATFPFFDDFTGASLDGGKWVTRQGSIGVDGIGHLSLQGTSGVRGLIDGLVSFPINAALHSRSIWNAGVQESTHFCAMRKSNDWNDRAGDAIGGTLVANKVSYAVYDGGSQSQETVFVADATVYHIYMITWKSAESKFYQDDVLYSTHTTNVPSDDEVVVFYEGNDDGDIILVDWTFVRKWVDPEPAHGVWGAEEPVVWPF